MEKGSAKFEKWFLFIEILDAWNILLILNCGPGSGFYYWERNMDFWIDIFVDAVELPELVNFILNI